jgi:hypothetical protein
MYLSKDRSALSVAYNAVRITLMDETFTGRGLEESLSTLVKLTQTILYTLIVGFAGSMLLSTIGVIANVFFESRKTSLLNNETLTVLQKQRRRHVEPLRRCEEG